MDKQQGSPFSEGRGRGFDIPDQKTPAVTNKERTKPLEIDLNNLNQPGVGPVDYDELRRGRTIPRLTTRQIGKTSGDID